MCDTTGTDPREQPATKPEDASATRDAADAAALRVEEARLAYGRAVATLEAIDDRAMHSVRIALFVVGFVSSAVGVAGPAAVGDAAVGVLLWLVAGVVALLAGTLRGIGVCSVTDQSPWPPPRVIPRSAESASDAQVRRLVRQYDARVRTLDDALETGAAALDRVQLLLRIGIIALSTAAGAFVLSEAYAVDGNVAAGLGLLVLVVTHRVGAVLSA